MTAEVKGKEDERNRMQLTGERFCLFRIFGERRRRCLPLVAVQLTRRVDFVVDLQLHLVGMFLYVAVHQRLRISVLLPILQSKIDINRRSFHLNPLNGRVGAVYVLNSNKGLVFNLHLGYLAFITRGIASDGMCSRVGRS